MSSPTEEGHQKWLSRRRSSVVERKHFDRSIIKDKPILWMMGKTGSGKGTQCSKLHARYGFTHLSSGELMRHEILANTDRSNFLSEIMKSGKPVPNLIVIEVIARAIVALAKESIGFVIDGFPLDEQQASEFVDEFGSPNLVLYLECNNSVLAGRLNDRSNFDDTAEAIANRFEVFTEHTKAVTQKYQAIGIKADKEKEEVFSEIEKLLQQKLNLKPQIE